MDDAALLPDFDPARHSQGGARRHELRRLDLERYHRRLCHSRIFVCDSPYHLVRRRLVLADLSIARPHLGWLVAVSVVGKDSRLFLAHHAAYRIHGAGRLRHHALLTKNSFLEELRKQYVLTARAKGCSERQV